MRRKVLAIILAALLALQVILPVHAMESASPSVRMYSPYWQDGVLYSFVQFLDPELVTQELRLMVNNQIVTETYAQPINSTNAIIHYLLLIDTSTSMSGQRSRILTFAEDLLQTTQNVKISVAEFNSVFSLKGSELSVYSDVEAIIRRLSFNKGGSDINGATATAMEYLGSKGYSAGEMPNLVIITDGQPWYADDARYEEEKEAESKQTLSAIMRAYPEILVHTLSFCDWDEEAFSPYDFSRGLHFSGDDYAAAGKQLCDFTDSLYKIAFSLPGFEQGTAAYESMMLCVGNNLLSYEKVRNAAVLPDVNFEVPEEVVPKETVMPTQPSETAPTDATAPEETQVSGETVADPKEADPEIAETETGNNEGITVHEDQDNQNTGHGFVIVAAAILLLLIVLVLLISQRRKHSQSICMKIEVLAGNGVRVKRMYYLRNDLTIGSDKNCDVVLLSAPDPVSTRIFVQGQMIYVENLGEACPMLLNGMRIFSSNRLRSGDEIAIGDISLRILF